MTARAWQFPRCLKTRAGAIRSATRPNGGAPSAEVELGRETAEKLRAARCPEKTVDSTVETGQRADGVERHPPGVDEDEPSAPGVRATAVSRREGKPEAEPVRRLLERKRATMRQPQSRRELVRSPALIDDVLNRPDDVLTAVETQGRHLQRALLPIAPARVTGTDFQLSRPPRLPSGSHLWRSGTDLFHAAAGEPLAG